MDAKETEKNDVASSSRFKTTSFGASGVEACRICLATDVKMYSLKDTYLGTLIETVPGFNKTYVGLPNYICYECAPSLIKCNKLLEKSQTAQNALLEMYTIYGQITKPLIEEHRNSHSLQSSLDSYLLVNYFYIKYDDDNSTSNFVKTEFDPNERINIKIKNEMNDDSSDEVSELLKMITDPPKDEGQGMKEDMNSDSDVEAIEVETPVCVISDDEKNEDDFISLNPYKMRLDNRPSKGKISHRFEAPLYDIPKLKGTTKKKKKKKTKKVKELWPTLSTKTPDEIYLEKYFNTDEIPVPKTNNKKYSCKFCFRSFTNIDEAKDHTMIGCTSQQSSSNKQVKVWEEWQGGNT